VAKYACRPPRLFGSLIGRSHRQPGDAKKEKGQAASNTHP
jgi:hypothetical protein